MNIDSLRHLLQAADLTVTSTDLGLSNENLLVRADGKDYIWRRPHAGSQPVHDHHTEALVMQEAAALDVPTLYFDPDTGEKLSRRVNAIPFGESRSSDRMERAGRLVSRLHERKPVREVFDPFEKLETYRQACQDPVPFPGETEILRETRALWRPDTLCHNDLVPGNLLLGTDRDWLIDYEYAATGDPRFDLASFLSENQVTDPADRQAFFRGYGRPVREREVILFELLADMIWASWAQMLLEQRQDPVFEEIRNDKLDHFANLKNKLVDIESECDIVDRHSGQSSL